MEEFVSDGRKTTYLDDVLNAIDHTLEGEPTESLMHPFTIRVLMWFIELALNKEVTIPDTQVTDKEQLEMCAFNHLEVDDKLRGKCITCKSYWKARPHLKSLLATYFKINLCADDG